MNGMRALKRRDRKAGFLSQPEEDAREGLLPANQEMGPQTLDLLAHWSWTAQPAELWGRNICCLSHLIYSAFVTAAWTKMKVKSQLSMLTLIAVDSVGWCSIATWVPPYQTHLVNTDNVLFHSGHLTSPLAEMQAGNEVGHDFLDAKLNMQRKNRRGFPAWISPNFR